jgi:hypothetical protein
MKLYELVETTAYGVTGEDPDTNILDVVFESELPKLKEKLKSKVDNCGYDSQSSIDDDGMHGRWVDTDCDTVTVLSIVAVVVLNI